MLITRSAECKNYTKNKSGIVSSVYKSKQV